MLGITRDVQRIIINFLRPLPLSETYELVINEAMRFVEADFGSILLEKNGNLERVCSLPEKLDIIKIRRGGYNYRVFKTGRGRILTRAQILRIHPESKKFGFQSEIVVPLAYHLRSIGVISVASKTKSYSSIDLDAMNFFAPLAMLAIQGARLLEDKEEAIRIRDLFISMAAHELRTPLTTVNGYLQLMAGRLESGRPISTEWLEISSAEMHRLIKLVNELLQANQLRTGTLQYRFTVCSLREVARRAILNLKMIFPDNEIVFEDRLVSPKDQVIGDFDKLLQVLINILNNACSYSPPGEGVVLALTAKGGNLTLSIVDHGKGISPQDQGKIFQEFYRGAKSGNKNGLGLGLYVAKRIIDSHRGRISLVSELGQGTIVKVTLPRYSG